MSRRRRAPPKRWRRRRPAATMTRTAPKRDGAVDKSVNKQPKIATRRRHRYDRCCAIVTRAVTSSLRIGPFTIRRKFEPAEPRSFSLGSSYRREGPNGEVCYPELALVASIADWSANLQSAERISLTSSAFAPVARIRDSAKPVVTRWPA